MGSDAPTTTCLDEDDVLGFVSGSLSDGERRAALSHIDDCEACRALATTLAQDDDVTNGRVTHELPPSSDKLQAAPLDGRFRLLARLGGGAMGIVYRARDEQLGTDVALKLLRDETPDASAARAFAREFKVGRQVSHPNVCRLFDAGQYDKAPYITMELLEGETLADVLTRGKLDEERAGRLLAEIAAGLAAVHAKGIVHRDLKPANVMVVRGADGERPVLTDFGFATELRGDHSRRLVGTPSFWAPEQARGEAPTPASDIYSFGLLAYRLLAGREFSLSDPAALDRLPRRWRGFVGRCLEPRPRDRFADGGVAVAALKRRTRSPAWALALAGSAGAAALALALALALRSAAPPASASPEPASARPIGMPVVSIPPPPPSAPPSTAQASAPEPSASAEKAPDITIPRPKNATGTRIGHPPHETSAKPPPSAAPAPPPAPSRQDDPLYRH